MSKLPSQTGSFWTPLYDPILQQYSLLTAAVFGIVWRYCQMKEGICRASVERISGQLNLNRTTVRRQLSKLIEDGIVIDRTPNLHNRPHIFVISAQYREILLTLNSSAQNNNAQNSKNESSDSHSDATSPGGARNDSTSRGDSQSSSKADSSDAHSNRKVDSSDAQSDSTFPGDAESSSKVIFSDAQSDSTFPSDAERSSKVIFSDAQSDSTSSSDAQSDSKAASSDAQSNRTSPGDAQSIRKTVSSDAQGDSKTVSSNAQNDSAVSKNNSRWRSKQQPADAQSDMSQTLLKDKLIEEKRSPKSKEEEEAILLWNQTLEHLYPQLPRQFIETWLKCTHPLSFREDVLSVGIINSYGRNLLESRIQAMTDGLLRAITARAGARVKFVTHYPKWPGSEL